MKAVIGFSDRPPFFFYESEAALLESCCYLMRESMAAGPYTDGGEAKRLVEQDTAQALAMIARMRGGGTGGYGVRTDDLRAAYTIVSAMERMVRDLPSVEAMFTLLGITSPALGQFRARLDQFAADLAGERGEGAKDVTR